MFDPTAYGLMNQDAAAFYHTMQRFSWSLAVAWVTFACACGYGGNLV